MHGRVAGITRSFGYLPRGWTAADLLPFERRLFELRDQVLTGQALPPSRPVTLDEFASPWFERLALGVELGRLSPLTYNKYEGDWRRHLQPAFGRLPLGALNEARLVKYMQEKLASGLSESSVKGSLIPLSGMLTDAVTAGHIPANPLRSPRRARHRGGGRNDLLDLQVRRRPPTYLHPADARRLLAAVPTAQRDMVLLALTTGFRRNEILAMQWEWVDFAAMRIDLRGQLYWRRGPNDRQRRPSIVKCKYDSEREVPLYSGLARLLEPRRQSKGFVFTNPDTGQPWKEGQPTEHFLEAAYNSTGLRQRGRMWHQLRHTYASVLAAGGVKRHELEVLMGHRAVGTTGLYTHLFREAYERVETALDSVYAYDGAHAARTPLRRSGSTTSSTYTASRTRRF